MAQTQDNFNAFYVAESTLSGATPSLLNGRSIYRFNPPYGVTRVPLHIRTGSSQMRNPGGSMERKKYRQIEFHGKGTLYCRVYVDGVWICDGSVTLTETPSKDRRLGIPIGTRGYNIDIEFCGDADIRALEVTYDNMSSTS